MKVILIIQLCFQCMLGIGQSRTDSLKQNGIYQTSNNYVKGELLLPFDNSAKKERHFKEPFFHSNQLWVVEKDSTYKFYCDDIWGFRRDGMDWRLYENEGYRILYNSNSIVYEQPLFTNGRISSSLYFSRELNLPIKSLTKANLLEVYHDYAAFVEKIKRLKLFQSPIKWNKETRHYVFMDWL